MSAHHPHRGDAPNRDRVLAAVLQALARAHGGTFIGTPSEVIGAAHRLRYGTEPPAITDDAARNQLLPLEGRRLDHLTVGLWRVPGSPHWRVIADAFAPGGPLRAWTPGIPDPLRLGVLGPLGRR